jgi:lipoic acid synthetase
VPRLYPVVRPGADYGRSLALLSVVAASRAESAARPVVKTGLMVGLGEREGEVYEVLRDCATAGVDVVTVGQYLQPARDRLPVERYWTLEEFAELERVGAAMRLRLIAAPFVRSSYRAGELLQPPGA